MCSGDTGTSRGCSATVIYGAILLLEEIATGVSWLKPTDFSEKPQDLLRMCEDTFRGDAMVTRP